MAPDETADLANIARNLEKWDRSYHWPEDGDEWKGQAVACGVPYPEWKHSLAEHLILPFVDRDTVALEIAPGHGRWTDYLVARASRVIAVDLSPSCLDFCRNRFRDAGTVEYVLTNGRELPATATGSVDFVWSYDAFVHMAPAVIAAYLREIWRVLKPGGLAIIHHANVADRHSHDQDRTPGWRSAVDTALMREMAEAAGLAVERQLQFWDEARGIGVPNGNDGITQLRRPSGRLQPDQARMSVPAP